MGRMRSSLRTLAAGFLSILSLYGAAQTIAVKNCKPPINRARWHDLIDKEQKNILKADGKADLFLLASTDEDISFLVTQAVIKKVDDLQCKIELDTATNSNEKVGYLVGAEKLLKNFLKEYRPRRIAASNFPAIIDTYESAMNRDKTGASIERIIDRSSYEVGNMVLSSGAFNANTAYKPSRDLLIRKYVNSHPEKIFEVLNDNPDLSFRDSLILIAAYKYPTKLYDYAAANNKLGYAIRKMDDPMIKAVSKMATSREGSGQLYFPFLDNILSGKQTIAEIDAVKEDDVKYYKLLVKTRLDYLDRILKKETLYGWDALDFRITHKAKNYFVKEINGLHEQPAAIRFRILQGLSAQELYYLAVLTEDEIYTSSYVNGVYPLIMQKIGNRADSLLMSVSFDRYKKFIKMAAGFNTLSNFLGAFPDKEQANRLMMAFVNNLEKSKGLEDGVDVADSYASISETIKPIAADMLANVKTNYDRNVAENNPRGIVIYDLLYKLFLSADSTKKIDLSKEFGIPPVYNVSYQSLASDSGQVVMQVFFYGDEDGRRNYQMYVPQFSGASWKKTEDTKQWITFRSTKGKPIVIYANKPLDEVNGDLDKAQAALNAHLSGKNIQPTVVVHRGHSYYAEYTIEQILPSAKIVFLGSCGGFHLIDKVLRNAPEAHIISSKQIGKQVINQPFMDLMNEKLRSGSNIDWVPFWKEFRGKAGKVEGFDDYIPPYKNLGAIFIKAYNSRMGQGGEEI
jgi:hypothetical protein